MRIDLVIDGRLMQTALETSGLQTKKAAIEEGLKLLVRFSRPAQFRACRGKLKWVGDLNEMRRNRSRS